MADVLFFDLGDSPVVTAPDLAAVDLQQATIDGQAAVCSRCSQRYGIGDSPFCKDGHGRWLTSKAENFAPYDDIGLGVTVESPDQRRRLMKEMKLDYRDKMRPGDLSARRDKVEQQKAHDRRAGLR